jgi:hypothetical protein
MRPRTFALWSALVVFIVASLLPVWFVSWQVVSSTPGFDFLPLARRATLWVALAHRLNDLQEGGFSWTLVRHGYGLPLGTAVALALGYGLGRLVYWSWWERPPVP